MSCSDRKFPCGQCDDWRQPGCPFGQTAARFMRFEPLPQKPPKFTDKFNIIEVLCKRTHGCA